MILGLICARGGSKRLPEKNLKTIQGKSLLALSIEHAKSCKLINKIIVSTDCPRIATEAKKNGAEVPFMRPKYLAKDDTPEWVVWKHALKFYSKKKIEALVITPTTSPLRNKIDIEKAINIFFSQKCDGVISVTESYRNPTFNIVKENRDKFAELAIKNKQKIYRSQDAEKYYDLTTVCYVVEPKFVLTKKHLFEGKLKLNFVPKDRSIDIDTKHDLLWARFLVKQSSFEN